MKARDPWFFVPRRVSAPALRLFCFPFAGGGASGFRSWVDGLPPEVELQAAQLPGREGRFREAPHTRLTDLVRDLMGALGPYSDVPFAFYGHSMGGLISFVLARELAKAGRPVPELLLISGRRAPHRPDHDPPLHDLPDDQLKARLRELEGTPASVLEDEEMLALLLPTLRADFKLCETWTYEDEGPIAIPIASFGGSEDHEATQGDLEAWSQITTGGHTNQMFSGGHFFQLGPNPAVLAAMSRHLRNRIARLRGRAPS